MNMEMEWLKTNLFLFLSVESWLSKQSVAKNMGENLLGG